MKNLVYFIIYAIVIILTIQFIKWVINADIPLWLKIFLLR